MSKFLRVLIILLIIIIIFFFLFSQKVLGPSQKEISKNNKNPFENINLEARAAIVYDYYLKKPIFELNPEAQLPLASLTKIMTVITTADIGREEVLTNDNIKSKIREALVKSSNLAAINLSANVKKFTEDNDFVKKMNEEAERLGLKQTYFLNETGLDISKSTAGAYGSAMDVIKMIDYGFKKYPELFEMSTTANENTNPYASTTTLILFSKTGLTNLAGGNLAIVFEAGLFHPIGIVVLGSSKEGRFEDTFKLMDATFRYFKENE